MFYTSLVGACDHLFFGRHAMSRATGVGPVTDEVCREYIKHMEALICGGMLNGRTVPQRRITIATLTSRYSQSREETPKERLLQCSCKT